MLTTKSLNIYINTLYLSCQTKSERHCLSPSLEMMWSILVFFIHLSLTFRFSSFLSIDLLGHCLLYLITYLRIYKAKWYDAWMEVPAMVSHAFQAFVCNAWVDGRVMLHFKNCIYISLWGGVAHYWSKKSGIINKVNDGYSDIMLSAFL